METSKKWVKCVNDGDDTFDLTVGKVYQVEDERADEYCVTDDEIMTWWYPKESFAEVQATLIIDGETIVGEERRELSDKDNQLLQEGLEILVDQKYVELYEAACEKDIDTVKGLVPEIESIHVLLSMFE